MIQGNNVDVAMTRRHFNLPRKVALRDSKIGKKLIRAWDVEKDQKKVMEVFLSNYKLLSSQRYWEMLRTVWIICGSLETVDVFKKLMKAPVKNRYCFSTPEEKEELDNLPDRFIVYRACNDRADEGIAWTYDKGYAEWYKESFNKQQINNRFVTKDEVFALINRNKEFEILIL